MLRKHSPMVSIDSYLLRSVEKLSSLIKQFSKKRKTQKWMQSSMLINQRSKQHFKLSKSFHNKKNVKHIDPEHTHTHKTSLTNFIFKSKLRQFSDHTLTHIFLVITKSHCTCTCIKSNKKYCVLCVKNIARLHKCLHVMTIWDMRKPL